MRSDQICICMHFFDNQTWVLLHLDASSPTPLSIPMLERLRCVRSLSNHRLCPGGAARGRRGCHWDRRQDDSELSNESFHCGIHRRLAFKKVSYFQIQKLFHNFFHAFRVSLRKLSLLLEWIRLASWSQAWDEGLCWENWLSLQWVSWLVSGRDGRRQEARISNPIKSTIEFIKSRHPDIPVNFGRAWPFFIFHEIRSCSTSPVGIFKVFLNFRKELHFLMLSVLSSCTRKGVVLDQETHEMNLGINFNSSWTALTLGEDTG